MIKNLFIGVLIFISLQVTSQYIQVESKVYHCDNLKGEKDELSRIQTILEVSTLDLEYFRIEIIMLFNGSNIFTQI